MARFGIFTLLGLSTLCAICCIHQTNAQSPALIDLNVLIQVLNSIATSGVSETPGGASLLNIKLLIQLLNGLATGNNSGVIGTDTLTNICNRACTNPPSSSNDNTDSLIAIRVAIEILRTVTTAGNAGARSGVSGSLLSINAVVSVLNVVAGERPNASGTSSGERVVKPIIGIDVLVEALNNHRRSRIGGGGRYCNIAQLNQRLQAAASRARESGSGSVLDVNAIVLILNQVTYRPSLISAMNTRLIRINVLIDTLNGLLGGSGNMDDTYTGNNALLSIDVSISLLNNCPRNGGGLLGLVGNLINNLINGLVGQGGLLDRLLGGPGGLAGVLRGVVDVILG